MKRLYLLPGMGCDHRLFQNLDLPKGIEVVPLDWIDPAGSRSLADQASLMAERIDTTVPFLIGGVSMGGMVAVEMGKFLSPEKIILISSAKGKHELPWYFRLLARTNLHRLFTDGGFRRMYKVAEKFMGLQGKPEKAIFYEMLLAHSVSFIRWSFEAVLKWDNREIPPGIVQIHGDQDRVIPLWCVEPDIVIKGGRHYMTLSRGKEVSEAIGSVLSWETDRS